MTAEDTRVLEFLAEHRVAIVSQVQVLLDCTPRTAERRLHRLVGADLVVRRRIFEGLPAACWITARGLGLLERQLPAPRLDLKCYRHDVGLAWMWIAAQNGVFGPLTGQISERAMRSADRRAVTLGSGREDALGGDALREDALREDALGGDALGGGAGLAGAVGRYGIGVAGTGPRGGLSLHYPDLILDAVSGHRIAVELELTAKTPGRLDRIMLGYAADPGVATVLYLCPPGPLGGRVQAAARRAGISDRVHVRQLAPGSPAGAPDPGRESGRSPSRDAGRSPSRDAGRSHGRRPFAPEPAAER
ncbi:MAG TPA: hypothetical protein VFP55_11160 [Solirubrobacteraceae bacterium]|nr:hypothetical protein [Solirubrobacteraceae bacterium]